MILPGVLRTGQIVCVAAGVLAGGAHWCAALAASACTGSLATSLIHPLPASLSVTLETSPDDTANPALARQFVAGLRRAGVTVSKQGSVLLSMSVTVVPSAGAAGGVGGTYKGFGWVSGEQAPTPGHGPGIRSANLSMSITLTDTAQSTLSWIASVQCKVQTDDSGAVAEGLGEVIGRSIGKNFDRRPI